MPLISIPKTKDGIADIDTRPLIKASRQEIGFKKKKKNGVLNNSYTVTHNKSQTSKN